MYHEHECFSMSGVDLFKQSFAPFGKFKTLLVANRGEIAIRIFRSAHELGLRTVAIYAYEDRFNRHRYKADESWQIGVQGQYSAVGAYLAIDEIIKIAKARNVDVIHPGYGFLAENSTFARKVRENGMEFIGPNHETIFDVGDKTRARNLAIKAGVPVIPGSDGPVQSIEEARNFVSKYGLPIMIKAANGGGGRGMRVVHDIKKLDETFERCKSEALSAFGDDTVFIERYLLKSKHIEVQILGDQDGNIIHMYERDCSVQRRHQKVVEVAPSIDIPTKIRQALWSDAIKLAKACNYINAGTVEFLVDHEYRHYFIEVNPRIQVEHTVTEEVTGIDIVATQIKIAAGYNLNEMGLSQDKIRIRGFAIQCRITTEDPENNFSPDTGIIQVYRSAGGNGIRLDGGSVHVGASVVPHYDSLLVKLTASASSFEGARRKALGSLVEFRIRGVKTNIPFLLNLIKNPVFVSGDIWTSFIDDTPELFMFAKTRNRATKMVMYLGDIIVNGSSIQGQSGEPGLRNEDPIVPNCTLSDIEPTGWRKIFLEKGPIAFAKAVREHKGCLIMDTTWRDAHQSLLATRVRTIDITRIAPLTSHLLQNAFSLEMWGGATFDVYIFLTLRYP
jgi:pyruvate carboxylase